MTIQQVASYWDGRPCNIRHSNKPIGTKEYFEEVSKRKYHVEPHIKDFAKFEIWERLKVLEIGCGIGTAMQSFAEGGALYVGVDLSSESIALAKKRVDTFGLKNVQLYCVNAEKLSEEIPPDKYDLIYSFGVLHHTPDEDSAFLEIKKFVKPGTEIKLMLYHKYSTKAFALWLKYGWKNKFSINRSVALQSEAEFGCPITRTYSKRAVLKIANTIGFQVTNIFVDHIFPYSVKPYVDYKYVCKWYWRIFPAQIFRFFETKLGWHLMIEGVFKHVD